MTDATYSADISSEQALQKALDQMEEGSNLDFEKGLREKIADRARKNFEDNHHLWKKFEATVLRSARQIGVFAEEFAKFEAEFGSGPATEVRENHAEEAIRVVKNFCPAGLVEGPRFRWCPSPKG